MHTNIPLLFQKLENSEVDTGHLNRIFHLDFPNLAVVQILHFPIKICGICQCYSGFKEHSMDIVHSAFGIRISFWIFMAVGTNRADKQARGCVSPTAIKTPNEMRIPNAFWKLCVLYTNQQFACLGYRYMHINRKIRWTYCLFFSLSFFFK